VFGGFHLKDRKGSIPFDLAKKSVQFRADKQGEKDGKYC